MHDRAAWATAPAPSAPGGSAAADAAWPRLPPACLSSTAAICATSAGPAPGGMRGTRPLPSTASSPAAGRAGSAGAGAATRTGNRRCAAAGTSRPAIIPDTSRARGSGACSRRRPLGSITSVRSGRTRPAAATMAATMAATGAASVAASAPET